MLLEKKCWTTKAKYTHHSLQNALLYGIEKDSTRANLRKAGLHYHAILVDESKDMTNKDQVTFANVLSVSLIIGLTEAVDADILATTVPVKCSKSEQ